MANFVEAKLNGDMELDLSMFEAKMSESVLRTGAQSMAQVIYEEVKLNASPPRLGRKTGNLEAAIYQAYSPEKSVNGSQTYRISWNKRKAPHGNLIEFGTSRAPAHPFLRPAFSRINEAIEAGKEGMQQRFKDVT